MRYILIHNKRHPGEMGALEIEAFLSHLVQEAHVSASTQNQVFNALLFLYRNVLQIELATPIRAMRVRRAQHLPTVLSKTEVNQVLSGMQGLHRAVKTAAKLAMINKPVSPHTFRHCFATPLLEAGYDIRTE